VRRAAPPHEEIREYRQRLPGDDNHLQGVDVAAWEELDGFEWQITIWAREYFRDDPLALELQQRLERALLADPGVSRVENASWETWDVSGAASGEALCPAAAERPGRAGRPGCEQRTRPARTETILVSVSAGRWPC